MNASTDSFGVRARRTFTRLVVVLVILGLGAVATVLLSQLNARTWSLAQEAGSLVVMKGRMLPWGALPFRPSDPALADAYAPIPLEGQSPGTLLERRFSDRDELDRALFELLERLATERITSSEPAELERGLYFVRRAERLAGMTEEQRMLLKKMQAEVSFYLARTKLDDARRLIADGLSQLKVASESDSRNARAAHQMIAEVEPTAQALEDALRKAVHSISEAPPPRSAPDTGTGTAPERPLPVTPEPQDAQQQTGPTAPAPEGTPPTGG